MRGQKHQAITYFAGLYLKSKVAAMRPAEKSRSHSGFRGRKWYIFTMYGRDVFGALFFTPSAALNYQIGTQKITSAPRHRSDVNNNIPRYHKLNFPVDQTYQISNYDCERLRREHFLKRILPKSTVFWPCSEIWIEKYY